MSFCRTDIRALAESIKAAEPVITESVMEQLVETLQKLQAKVCDTNPKRYYKYKTLQTHLLPLTNIAFDKLGKRYSRLRLPHHNSKFIYHYLSLKIKSNVRINQKWMDEVIFNIKYKLF